LHAVLQQQLRCARNFCAGSDETRHTRTRPGCRRDTIQDLIRARYGWLLVFFFGLMLAALVVEAFESVLRAHVELSMFVPLLIGHGGNTGSQSNATVIRSLALGHLKPSDWLVVVYKVGLCGGPLSSAFVADCCVTRRWREQCLGSMG
jgi:cation transporter-like permease